jgi:peptidyl-prolyl cis-trans isomerase SurA
MKKFFILAAASLCSNAIFSQTLISYGNSVTGKDEFLRAYNKNKPATSNKEKSIKEYLELYTNFKLKVKAAQELRLDTIAQIKYDIQNFRDQITDNYLNDEVGLQALIKEAAYRSQKDIHILYFLVPINEKATPSDTLKAYNAAKELYNKLKIGSVDYADIVTTITNKLSSAKYSDAGFITAFTLPYEYENIIYNTKLNSISEPYKTSKGWVIFKPTEERQNTGKWKAAQLLFAYPPDADYNTKLAVKQKADSVYELLQKGLSFADAAKNYSDDRMTYLTGGEMPEFYTGKYNSDYEKKIFALNADNTISKPFETSFGYHIVKRLSNTPLPQDKNDATYLFDIKQKVQQDERINTVKEKFVNDITSKTGFKKVAGVSDAEFFKYVDSLKNNAALNTDKFSINKKPILSFKDGSVIKGNEWIKYLRNMGGNPEMKPQSNNELWKNFTKKQILNYYKLHLEEYNSDFKYQMQEFKEGNMLFEIMERNVWSKAGQDSAGLLNYYNANKFNYKWQASADVLIFNCANEKNATEAIQLLKTGQQWQTIAQNSNSQIQADSGRYEIAQLPADSGVTLKPQAGEFSPIIKNADGTTAFVKFVKIYNANMQRNFTEARGLVINDYQNILEQRWVEVLRKKYPVQINNAVLNDIIK